MNNPYVLIFLKSLLVVSCDIMIVKQILNTFLNVEKEAEKSNKMVLKYNEKYHHKNEIKNAEMLLRRLGL